MLLHLLLLLPPLNDSLSDTDWRENLQNLHGTQSPRFSKHQGWQVSRVGFGRLCTEFADFVVFVHIF